MTLAECTAHRDNCMKVAVQVVALVAARFASSGLAFLQAGAGKRRAHLGVHYDDVCRRVAAALRCKCERACECIGVQEWAERARAALQACFARNNTGRRVVPKKEKE